MSTERTLSTNGVDLHLVEDGPTDGPLVVLAHGFPELSYSWRHQLPALADAGYRVVAPDQRGYGRSSCPEGSAPYDIVQLTTDLLGILDDAGREKATFIGHDWGSMVVWQQALLHPDRVHAVCGMSVPFLPRAPMPPVDLMRMAFQGKFFYIVYFQDEGVAEVELGSDPARTMRRLLAGASIREGVLPPEGFDALDGRGFVDRMPEPDGLPDWLTQEELDHYVEEFSRTGFRGGVSWYRNFNRNWELTPQLEGAHVTQPSLFIGGTADPVLVMSPPSTGAAFLDDHRGDVLIEGAGHWVQQEAPKETNDALLEFLNAVH